MKKLIFLLMAILVASSAFAIIDPDSDSVGVYFDMTADTMEMDMAAPGAMTAYLLLTNPSGSEIGGFEAGLTIDGPSTPAVTTFDNPTALNVGTATNMIVGFGTPTPATEVTLLATIDIYYIGGPDDVLSIYLSGSTPSSADPDYPVVVNDGAILITAMPVMAGMPCAGANLPETPVATQSMSFDNVKSLYR